MVETTWNLNTNLERAEVIHHWVFLCINQELRIFSPFMRYSAILGFLLLICFFFETGSHYIAWLAGLELCMYTRLAFKNGSHVITVRLVIPNRQEHYWLSYLNLVSNYWTCFPFSDFQSILLNWIAFPCVSMWTEKRNEGRHKSNRPLQQGTALRRLA